MRHSQTSLVAFLLALTVMIASCGSSTTAKPEMFIYPDVCEINAGQSINLSLKPTSNNPMPANRSIEWVAGNGTFSKPREFATTYTPEVKGYEQNLEITAFLTVTNTTYPYTVQCKVAAATVSGPTAISVIKPGPTSLTIPTDSATAPPVANAPTSTTSEPTFVPVPLITPTPEPPKPTIATPPEDLPTTVRIAVQGPLSGKWGNQGIGIRNAVELAINEQGQSLQNARALNLEMVAYDDQADQAIGKATASEAVRDPNVLCVIGHYNSGVTNAAYEEVYRAAKMVVIPSSTNPSVTDQNDTVWRLVGRDDILGAVAANFAREQLGARSAYIIHDDTPYGRPAARYFEQNFVARQGEVLAFKPYNPDNIDFGPLIDEIISRPPDLIYFAGVGLEAGEFIKQVRAAGSRATVLGPDGLDTSDILVSGGADVVGTYFVTVAAPISEFPGAASFAERYRRAYRQEPTSFTAENYDAATLCIQAIDKAARQDGTGRKPTREQVLTAMQVLATEPFQGISGNYRFNANGDPQVAKYYIFQITSERWGENKLVEGIAANAPQP